MFKILARNANRRVAVHNGIPRQIRTSFASFSTLNNSLLDQKPDTNPEEILKSSDKIDYSSFDNSDFFITGDNSDKSLSFDISPFRNPDFTLKNTKARTSQQARLSDNALLGKFNRFGQVKIPTILSDTINDYFLRKYEPAKLREYATSYFLHLRFNPLHKPPTTPYEVDTSICVLFPQNYASIFQVLAELKGNVSSKDKTFNPQKILVTEQGPATGMLALNELMGEDFQPQVRDIYIKHSNYVMENRAKVLLSRQLSEVPRSDIDNSSDKDNNDSNDTSNNQDDNISKNDYESAEPQLDGQIDVKKIKINSKFLDHLPTKNSPRKYDLIIATHQLLEDEKLFPRQIDNNLEKLLDLLEPEGHLVLIERGTFWGFEILSRAREITMRPSNYSKFEYGKIPRPWIRGSTMKVVNKLLNTDSANNKKFNRKQKISDLESELNEKYGQIHENDLDYEKDLHENFDILSVKDSIQEKAIEIEKELKTDYYLSILSPYPHHLPCQLVTKNPLLIDEKNGSKLRWLKFSVSLERPKFTMELKKGRRLAATWDPKLLGLYKTGEFSTSNPFGLKNIAKSGTGRAGGKNFEIANFCFLIFERSKNDPETIQKIEEKRLESQVTSKRLETLRKFKDQNSILKTEELLSKIKQDCLDRNDSSLWPRIIDLPEKKKGHVVLDVLTPFGSFEKWNIPKSYGKQHYYDARKAKMGDSWPSGYKSTHVLPRVNNLSKLFSGTNVQFEYGKAAKKTEKIIKKAIKRELIENDDSELRGDMLLFDNKIEERISRTKELIKKVQPNLSKEQNALVSEKYLEEVYGKVK
ncbi:tRNA methyltransferase RSM22 [Ascoidea rubescens DSM 1968]|uniref:Mitochondrial ribosomal protein n=1 Tax=Ascoidea rubescens DSM 1968 TaxID=1344418 RepID=A0A1D2VNK8_9ASCO|nr:mitochondrial ribosomal protein [Ascoidea rubescens DSM 1968]ODV63157.1 mitochondrial ribosomal protein [Ascoidea rubescens DSM 1968]